MTANELRIRLKEMSQDDRLAFLRCVGWFPDFDDERILDAFVKESAWEKKICDALSVPTEADKVGQASIDAAHYARLGYIIGLVAIGIAVISLVVSGIALVK